MTPPYTEKPSHRFPGKLDMLAQFGLDPDVEDDAVPSLSYKFISGDEMSMIVTYSDLIHFVDVTLSVGEDEVFSIATNDVAEMRICAERGACWLQVAYEPERRLQDLYIYIEPKLSCRWG